VTALPVVHVQRWFFVLLPVVVQVGKLTRLFCGVLLDELQNFYFVGVHVILDFHELYNDDLANLRPLEHVDIEKAQFVRFRVEA